MALMQKREMIQWELQSIVAKAVLGVKGVKRGQALGKTNSFTL